MVHQIVWFRNDLRIHDHEPLLEACRAALRAGGGVIPVFILEPRHNDLTKHGFPRIGSFRARFLRESLEDLHESLQSLGSELQLFYGQPAAIIASIAEKYAVEAVWFHREYATEELQAEEQVRTELQSTGTLCRVSPPCTLYLEAELPFSLTQLPEVFTRFRKRVEQDAKVPAPLPAPDNVPASNLGPFGGADAQLLPANAEGFAMLRAESPVDRRASIAFQGGEKAGLARIKQYFWEGDHLRRYKQTRNGMLGADYSSKLAPWLAHGCLSARMIHGEVSRYEIERVRNESTYWLVFELLWRDYFQFIVGKHGAAVFHSGGLRRQKLPWKSDSSLFDAWRYGETGYPLIDANMRELASTGFMSNRGRQNVASFLTKNLGIDWRMGAEWFESMLIDYDPCSNYGNWNYTAGVGNDARGFRWFNTIKQARDYDADGRYVRHWLPVLKDVPARHIHSPWKLHPAEQQRCRCVIGQDYPSPIVDLYESARINQQDYEAAVAGQL